MIPTASEDTVAIGASVVVVVAMTSLPVVVLVSVTSLPAVVVVAVTESVVVSVVEALQVIQQLRYRLQKHELKHQQ